MSDHDVPLPEYTKWPSFPFEGDMRVRRLDDPVEVEPARHGEDAAACVACSTPDEAYIWVSDRWRVRGMERPTGLPMVLILESRSHLDLGDLHNMLAAELGLMTVRLERAVRSLDDVARVHVNRWGDGSAHLHLWFLARPKGRLQLRGTFLSLWDDILPPISEMQWRENLAMVAAWLAEFDGRALAEPPHIAWQAPSTFSSPVPDEVKQAVEPAEPLTPEVIDLAPSSPVDPAPRGPVDPAPADPVDLASGDPAPAPGSLEEQTQEPLVAGVRTGRPEDGIPPDTGAGADRPTEQAGEPTATGARSQDLGRPSAGTAEPEPEGVETTSSRQRAEHGATPAQRSAPDIEVGDTKKSVPDSPDADPSDVALGAPGAPVADELVRRGTTAGDQTPMAGAEADISAPRSAAPSGDAARSGDGIATDADAPTAATNEPAELRERVNGSPAPSGR